jgi:putative protein kinase ArgK-like GTPase of G3E family
MDPEDLKIYIEGVRSQNRRILSKTITLIESSRPDHQQLARKIVDQLLPHTGKAVRLGITGVPAKVLSSKVSACCLWEAAIGWQFWQWIPAVREAAAA